MYFFIASFVKSIDIFVTDNCTDMSIPLFDTYKEGGYLRPNEDIDPKLKSNDPTYCLNWAKYIYSAYVTGRSAITPEKIERIRKNRMYAEGRQDTSVYRDWIFGKRGKSKPTIPIVDKDTNELVSDMIEENLAEKNLNFDEVFSPLPKYVSNIIGIMASQEHDIVVDAEDENSGTLKEEMKFEAWIREELKPVLEEFNIMLNIPDATQQQVKPKSLEELELFENIGAFKLPYEVAMEKLLSHTEFISKYEKLIKENIIADFVTIGMSATATYFDFNSGKVKYKWVDVEDLILENSRLNDFSDSSWGGYIEYYTVHQIRMETGLKEDDIYQLASKYVNMFGNPGSISPDMVDGRYNYDDFQIPVLHAIWKAVDTEYYTKKTKDGITSYHYEPYRTTKKGKPIPPKVYNKENKKTSKTSIRRLYHARWIIDTDYLFDYGIVTNTPYNYGTNDVEFPISMYKIKGKPPIESMIPVEDQIYLSYIKLQSAIAKAAPPGLAIDMNSLDNITWGNKKIKPRDSIKIYTVSGNIFYRLTPKGLPGMGNGGSPPTPITELKGGLGTAVADGIRAIEFLYHQLDVISGIDGITSANTTPSRDTGKAVSEMAIAATSNTLKPIYSGYIDLKERNAKCAGWMIAANLEAYDDVKESPYFRAVGEGNLLAIKAASNFPPAVYGFRIEARLTEQQKQMMLAAAQAGLAGGKNGIPALTYSEYSFIVRHLTTGKSVKYIEMWMAKKEQERAIAEQKAAQEAQITQGKLTQELEQQKEESERALIQMQTEKELKIIAAKGEEERKTIREKYKYEGQILNKQLIMNNLNNQNKEH